jgi:hypothetical protein
LFDLERRLPRQTSVSVSQNSLKAEPQCANLLFGDTDSSRPKASNQRCASGGGRTQEVPAVQVRHAFRPLMPLVARRRRCEAVSPSKASEAALIARIPVAIAYSQLLDRFISGVAQSSSGDAKMSVPGRFCCKSPLRIAANSDSVALTGSAVEAGDDGAAEPQSRKAVLFIPS